MKAAFHTLGCKVNQYETEALKEKFNAGGWEITGENDFADVYVINTCTVTALADRKSRQFIRRAKKINPAAIIAVTGCYAQMSPDEVGEIEDVDIIAGTDEKNELPEYVTECIKKRQRQIHVGAGDEMTVYRKTGIITSMESRTRAYIKIEEGCNRFCSYCVIPYARGPVRSRDIEEITKEAAALIEKGFKEIILTGINTALYGADFSCDAKNGDLPLTKVLDRLESLPGNFRIRLSSLEPTVIDAEGVRELFRYGRLCHHLHLSLQSGSDRILSAMNRNYDRSEYLQIVETLRQYDPLYGISTDIIAGFPGETEADFADSLQMIQEAQFCKVHAFKYSKRKKTAAADMSGQVSAAEKKDRSGRLIAAGEESATEFFRRNIGSSLTVLFEEYSGQEGFVSGYSENYIKVYAFCSEEEAEGYLNEFYTTKIVSLYRDGVKGILTEVKKYDKKE